MARPPRQRLPSRPPVVPTILCAVGPPPPRWSTLRAAGYRRVAVAEYLLTPGFFACRAAKAASCLTSAPPAAHDALAGLVALHSREAAASASL
ncbi:hypothetical protein [Kitasatospora kifunensis]|nr:hypothetical protein [Kitasatospora kifunensis]